MNKRIICLLVLLLISLLEQQILVYAQEGEKEPKSQFLQRREVSPPRPPEIGFLAFIRLFIALIVILGLIYAAVYLMRRFWSRQITQPSTSNLFSILGVLHLSPKKTIYMIGMPGRILILGVSENRIEMLSEITDQEEIELIKSSAGDVTSFSFLSHLKRWSGKIGKGI